MTGRVLLLGDGDRKNVRRQLGDGDRKNIRSW